MLREGSEFAIAHDRILSFVLGRETHTINFHAQPYPPPPHTHTHTNIIPASEIRSTTLIRIVLVASS